MVVTQGEVESLKLSVGVSSIEMNARVLRHEVEGFIQDGQSLLEPVLLEEAGSHVVVCQADLDCHVVFKAFCVHELGCSLEITQRLVVVVSLSVDARPQEKELRHVME